MNLDKQYHGTRDGKKLGDWDSWEKEEAKKAEAAKEAEKKMVLAREASRKLKLGVAESAPAKKSKKKES